MLNRNTKHRGMSARSHQRRKKRDVAGLTDSPNTISSTASKKSDKKSDGGTGEVLIRVGGTLFALDQGTIDAFDSDYLNKCVDPDTHFRKPKNGVYKVEEASAEHFSALLHMVRHGSLPCGMIVTTDREEVLLEQADFWGVTTKVKEAIEDAKEKSTLCSNAMQRLAEIERHIGTQRSHHNHRQVAEEDTEIVHGDEHGRWIYCEDCGQNETHGTFQVGDEYARCIGCRKMITYKPDLGWCHKCWLCRDCQNGGECPANERVRHHRHHVGGEEEKSTGELEVEVDEIKYSVRVLI